MKVLILLLIGLLVILTAFKPLTDCGCNYLGEATHKREKIKNRAPANMVSASTITIAEMLAMKITAVEKKEVKASPDVALAREKKVVTVSGYAWIIKLSDEDCDIHIELSETNDPKAKRIIAEIPNTTAYCDRHKKVLSDLITKYQLPEKTEYHFDKKDNEGKAIKLSVSGYLFWDSGHPTNSHHGSDKVGSVWEIHPVAKLSWD